MLHRRFRLGIVILSTLMPVGGLSLSSCVDRATSKSIETALAPDRILTQSPSPSAIVSSPSPSPSPVTTTPAPTDTSTPSPSPTTQTNRYLQDSIELGAIDLPPDNPTKIVTRGEYARWLVGAYNRIDNRQPLQQLQLATEDAKPLFTDVPTSHRDFPSIQGLAEAGFIPSSLSGDGKTTNFRPDAPLDRQSLIQWKAALDARKSLPAVDTAAIDRTWGFQDASKIDKPALSAIARDFEGGNKSNIRRTFGYITLFQPQKPVTVTEAAATLWYFGTNESGRSAPEAKSSE
jgi:hypothetical protein